MKVSKKWVKLFEYSQKNIYTIFSITKSVSKFWLKSPPLSFFFVKLFSRFYRELRLGAQNTHPYIWAFNNYFYTAIEMTVFQFNINAIWAWFKLYYLWQSSLHHGLMGSRIYVNGGSTQFSFTKILSKQSYITSSRVVHIIWVNIF